MKTTTIKGFAGLTYVTVSHVPLRKTELGDVINLAPRELEKLVAIALIEHKIPITGAEFRLLKSAINLSNEAISEKLGVSRNTVLKWGKDLQRRLPLPYEMLVRLLVADLLNIEISPSIDELKAGDRTKKISVTAA